MCNVPSLNISVLAQSKVGTYFRLHLGNRCSGTDGHRISFKNVKENPLPSPFFAIYEGAVKAFNAVGDSYVLRNSINKKAVNKSFTIILYEQEQQ